MRLDDNNLERHKRIETKEIKFGTEKLMRQEMRQIISLMIHFVKENYLAERFQQ
jgi:hypothetical protein